MEGFKIKSEIERSMIEETFADHFLVKAKAEEKT